jgi:hypothetical protein
MTPTEVDRFLADQRKVDAIRALTKARSEEEVTAIARRFELAQVEDEGDEVRP